MKAKETYSIEVGDKITCHCENWEEDKNYSAYRQHPHKLRLT